MKLKVGIFFQGQLSTRQSPAKKRESLVSMSRSLTCSLYFLFLSDWNKQSCSNHVSALLLHVEEIFPARKNKQGSSELSGTTTIIGTVFETDW
jgi:hypothetical protein